MKRIEYESIVCGQIEGASKQIGVEHFGAHDLRRTCAKLCRKNGGDLEQIKFLLGHSSIQTTERYLGSEQDIEIAVNDNLGCSSKARCIVNLANLSQKHKLPKKVIPNGPY